MISLMLIHEMHHTAIPVRDLKRSVRFYRDVLGLQEVARPPFPFPGAWFELPDGRQIHLIVRQDGAFRDGQGMDTRDTHLALRVKDFHAAVAHFERSALEMVVDLHATAGFPQLFLLDPDRHVIEINAASA